MNLSAEELIAAAANTLNPHYNGDRLFGNVAAALLTSGGNLHLGVCIDTGSGTGFCAEHSAIAAMITAGEYRIRRITAVWKDDHGQLFVLPPCGRCREFIRQIDPANLESEIVLADDRMPRLKELLPEHGWPSPYSPLRD